ncbi:hypothetical protein CC2G_010173 [Coprinopsis cinerea AmutBmut pab1-1]|nr:hypothetical protein CC2G_010173 [Coprinopsis cinerea AmutBmut pab1-1]
MPPKRKAEESAAAASKKLKLVEEGASKVEAILKDASTFEVPEGDDEVRKEMLQLAQYARMLEDELAALKPKPKSAEDLAKEVDKLASVICSGIKKQMSWKPSCKTGSAKWVYDGLCNDPLVFGMLFKQGGPPKFKAKKFSADEFHNCVGSFHGSVRYDYLYLRSDVNVRWIGDGTFKLSGSYGV